MTYNSHRNVRGWCTAILLLFAVLGIFSYVYWPDLVEAYRKQNEVAVAAQPPCSTKAPANLATDDFSPTKYCPIDFDSTTNQWLNYRSRPSTSSFAILDPQAGARLLAPQALTMGSDGVIASNTPRESGSSSQPWTFNDQSSSRLVSTVAADQSLQASTETKRLSSKRILDDSSKLWPYPEDLLTELAELDEIPTNDPNVSLAWGKRVAEAIVDLRGCPTNETSSCLDSLESLAAEGIANLATSELSDREQKQLRIGHSLIRRLAIWRAVWECVSQTYVAKVRTPFEMSRLELSLRQLELELDATGDRKGWESFLLLNDLNAISQGDTSTLAVAVETAQVVLTRIVSTQVSAAQREFLDSSTVRELVDCLQPLAVSPVNYGRLLADIEMVEHDPEHRSYVTLISALQSLRFAEDPKQAAISQAIDTYYRNSNVRIAVSQKLVQRMLPSKKTLQRPVRQTILGADTRGNSFVDTVLNVGLVPDPNAWHIDLELQGHIRSQTHSARGPATFFNASNSNVETKRSIRITPEGVRVQAGQAQVESNDALRGMETAYDGLPFIGEMVRYMAEKEFKEKRGPARRIMQRSIAEQTDAEFDKQLNSQIEQVETRFQERILGPLRNLNLNPMVTDLQTTEERLIARYRIASDNSLAANTPRPQAPSDALLSIQLHQSALNNSFSRLELSARDWTLLELIQSLASQFGQEPITELPAEVPSDLTVRFDGDRPVLIEFIDGQLRLTMRVAELNQPGRIRLSDFTIRTTYSPGVDGLKAELIQDGPISIDADGLRAGEKVMLRVIFGKVFAARKNIPLVNDSLTNDPRAEGLAISQIVIEQGWLAVAISEQVSPHVALLRSLQLTR